MKKKVKSQSEVSYYFDAARNYQGVASAEASFFSSLIANKNDLRGNYSVHQALNTAGTFLQEPSGRNLDVLVEFHVNDPRSKVAQRMYLGTKLSPPGTGIEAQITHFLCLGDGDNFLTKIHHDRDFNPDAPEKKPSTHIQVGGRVGGSLAAKCAGICCWEENLDKPRIPSIPVCTALLWHWAFLEYSEAEQVANILQAPWWSNIVHEAENAILKPFFDDGLKLMTHSSQTHFLNAFYKLVPKLT